MSLPVTPAVPSPVVHVVDDDESAEEFLAQMPTGPGCLVLDLQLLGHSGTERQDRLGTAPVGKVR